MRWKLFWEKKPITFDASLLVEESLALCYLKLLRFYKDLFVVLFDENELW
jgi:hypothetical protein